METKGSLPPPQEPATCHPELHQSMPPPPSYVLHLVPNLLSLFHCFTASKDQTKL